MKRNEKIRAPSIRENSYSNSKTSCVRGRGQEVVVAFGQVAQNTFKDCLALVRQAIDTQAVGFDALGAVGTMKRPGPTSDAFGELRCDRSRRRSQNFLPRSVADPAESSALPAGRARPREFGHLLEVGLTAREFSFG